MTVPLESLAFAIGIKPALRLRLDGPDAAREELEWLRRGAAVVRGPSGLLYVARDAAQARAIERAEASILPAGPPRSPGAGVCTAHRELGRLLGYPSCCVEAFVGRVVRGVDVLDDGSRATELVVAVAAALSRSRRRLAHLNFTLPDRRALLPFDPCAFDCPYAARYARALFDAYLERQEAEARALLSELGRPVRLTRAGERLHPDDPAEAFLSVEFDEP